jgi:hypothetical protein
VWIAQVKVTGSDAINVERSVMKWVLGPWTESSSYGGKCLRYCSFYLSEKNCLKAERRSLAIFGISGYHITWYDI